MAATRLHHAAWEARKGRALSKRRRKCEACDRRIAVPSLCLLRKHVAINVGGTTSCTVPLEHLFAPCLYDGWDVPVGGRVRVVSGTPEKSSKLGGPFRGAGHDFARGETMGVPLVVIFHFRTPNGRSFQGRKYGIFKFKLVSRTQGAVG